MEVIADVLDADEHADAADDGTAATAASDATAGDGAEGFDEFYVRTRDRLALQIAALTGDPAEAADHVQEAFIRAWSRWRTVGAMDDPEGWVRRVAHNLAVSRWRRARRLVLRGQPLQGSQVLFATEVQDPTLS